MFTLEEYQEKVDKLKDWAEAYYVYDKPIVDDKTYDKLYDEVKKIEKLHPEFIDPSSPTQKVGDKLITSLPINKHTSRMYSLENTFSVEEAMKWINGIIEEFPNDNHTICIDYKYDGLSMSILYENGKLVRALTRGDGEVGEVITENALNVNNVLREFGVPGCSYELRGEVVMLKDSFEDNNRRLIERGESPLSNQRNGASGSLRQKDPNVTKERNLHFIPWGIEFIDPVVDKDFSYDMEFIQDNYRRTDSRLVLGRPFWIDKPSEIEQAIRSIYTRVFASRDKIPLPLDGLVISFVSRDLRKKLGYTSKYPKFARALKFPHMEHMTKLNAITWQVGRTGVITPVGEIDPVNIDGAVITRCTLHNLNDIYSKDIKLYDTVYIIRSGDVIPKVLGPVADKRTGKEETILPPTNCPSCNSPVKGPVDGKVFCMNPCCRDKIVATITYMSSRECLDIDGLGNKVVEQLFDTGLVKHPKDVFTLTYEDLLTLDGFSDKKASNLIESINKVKGIDLWKFISSLGIPLLGKTYSKLIAKTFGLEFLDKSKEEYENLPGIGVVTALAVKTEIENRKEEIRSLLETIGPVAKENIKGPLSGYRICITGVFDKPRNAIAKEIESLGGIVVPGVTRVTTHLLAGNNAGSKMEKAEYLGIPILTMDKLNEMINSF